MAPKDGLAAARRDQEVAAARIQAVQRGRSSRALLAAASGPEAAAGATSAPTAARAKKVGPVPVAQGGPAVPKVKAPAAAAGAASTSAARASTSSRSSIPRRGSAPAGPGAAARGARRPSPSPPPAASARLPAVAADRGHAPPRQAHEEFAPGPRSPRSGVLVAEDACGSLAWARNSRRKDATRERAADALRPGSSLQDLLQKLTRFDDQLAEVLERGDVRLVRTAWLLRQPPTYRMQYRQELEQREREGESPTPLLSCAEAVDALRRGDRSVGAVTYGWLSPGDPDPAGARIAVVREALQTLAHTQALFWDYPSLFQKPRGGKRTEAEDLAFKRALDVMGDLYASAVGTTVLQLKEIPPRPREFDGDVCLFNLRPGVSDELVLSTFRSFGEVSSWRLEGGSQGPPTVSFATHDGALAAKRAFLENKGPTWCESADTMYNEQSYDGAALGEGGLAKDSGRGWCIFESSVSSELIARLASGYPYMYEALKSLPPKMHALSSHGSPREVDPKHDEDVAARVKRVLRQISKAKFTGKGDHEKVSGLYRTYVERIADALAATFGSLHSSIDFLPMPHQLPPELAESLGQEAKEFTITRDRGGSDGYEVYKGVVASVEAKGPAYQAGMRQGDVDSIITHVDGVEVTVKNVVAALDATRGPDRTFTIRVKKEGFADALALNVEGQRVLARPASIHPRSSSALQFAVVEGDTVFEVVGWTPMLWSVTPFGGSAGDVLPWSSSVAGHDVPAFLGGLRALPGDLAAMDLELFDTRLHPDKGEIVYGGAMKVAAAVRSNFALRCLLGGLECSKGVLELVDQLEGIEDFDERKSLQESIYDFSIKIKLDMRKLALSPDKSAVNVFRASGVAGYSCQGVCCYGPGRMIAVRHAGSWQDAAVLKSGVGHELEIGDRRVAVSLNPWNHAVRQLPHAEFEKIHRWFVESLRIRHATVADALTGKRLDVLKHCVLVKVLGGDATQDVREQDVSSLSQWLATHSDKCANGQSSKPVSLLITAPPASGKTTFVSQLITLLLARGSSMEGLVPIVIKAGSLHEQLVQRPAVFSRAWNWFDAYLYLVSGPGLGLYRYFRQALLARRALLLLDGLDEGGSSRHRIADHVVQVLVPQGHMVVTTSRPIGIDREKFRSEGVRLMQLAPLDHAQQAQILAKRFGCDARASELLEFIQEKLPVDTSTGKPMSSNPLMLSMCASVYELRTGGSSMPDTVYRLYDFATDAIMTRGGISEDTRRVLEVIFLEAQIRGQRVITEYHLDTVGSLMLALKPTDSAVEAFKIDLQMDRIPLISLLQDSPLQIQASHLSFQEYYAVKAFSRVYTRLPQSRCEPWQWPASFVNFIQLGIEHGSDFAKCLRYAAGGSELHWQPEAGHAIGSEHRLTISGELEPNSHWQVTLSAILVMLSQVSTAQVALRTPQGVPRVAHIEHLQVRKDTAKVLGQTSVKFRHMEDAEAKALTRLLSVPRHVLPTIETLSSIDFGEGCSVSLPTAGALLAAVSSLSRVQVQGLDERAPTWLALLSADMAAGIVEGPDGAAEGPDGTTQHLHLARCRNDMALGARGAEALAALLPRCPALRALDLTSNHVGDAGAEALAEALGALGQLQKLHLYENSIGAAGAQALAKALPSLTRLNHLDLDRNQLGEAGAAALAGALPAMREMQHLFLKTNQLGDLGAIALAEALPDVPKLITLWLQENDIGEEGAAALAKTLPTMKLLETLWLHDNIIGDEGAEALAKVLPAMEKLQVLRVLEGNSVGEEAEGKLRRASGASAELK